MAIILIAMLVSCAVDLHIEQKEENKHVHSLSFLEVGWSKNVKNI